jgi:hypothetical protein
MNTAWFEKFFMPEPNTGCWIWLGHINSKGYGKAAHEWAHRLSFLLHRGPIPENLELDHKCRLRCCVNPDHLEAVTHLVNVRRGQSAKQTHCKRFHEFSELNTYIDSNGRRSCRICRRNAIQRFRERKAA